MTGRAGHAGIWPIGFLTTVEWNPNTNEYGILAEIWGTLYSSFLALIFGGGLGIAVAIFLTQGFLNARLAWVFRLIVEMLAAIPSVVFGLWGIYVLIPAIRPIATLAARHPAASFRSFPPSLPVPACSRP